MPDRCKTKYPIVFIHGVGVKDYPFFNYWGRIPSTLVKEGARVFYGQQDCWGSIEYNGEIIRQRILKIINETDCGKVNLIAHSKGGLDARYMISCLDMEDHVASLTTMSTPHHGSKVMDLLYRCPVLLGKLVAFFVNLYFRLLGDKKPDFYTSCRQFSTIFCKEFNTRVHDSPKVYYQSYASVMPHFHSDIIMSSTWFLVRLFDGDNDGLVSPDACHWGEYHGMLHTKTSRGISHIDIIDFRRSIGDSLDIPGKYIDIVEDLKNRGF